MKNMITILKGTTVFFTCRDDKTRGGTCMFVKSSLWIGTVIHRVEAKHSLLLVHGALIQVHLLITYWSTVTNTHTISNIGPLDNSIRDHNIIVCDGNNTPNITKYNNDNIQMVNERSNIDYNTLNNYLRCVLQNLTLNYNSNSAYNMLIQHIEKGIKANSINIDIGLRTSNKNNIRNTWGTQELVDFMHRRDLFTALKNDD
ncbi:hypothetical protein PR048_020662 [Dryococelus australis]|uniref:Uncharacterized protein n=1 Tax=Dryococelus australis TaxID=614101 RepID=A0ABQ9H6W1_9NEOP|nr:hypothetical protein PR048_020662 [Dryococelus australis]